MLLARVRLLNNICLFKVSFEIQITLTTHLTEESLSCIESSRKKIFINCPKYKLQQNKCVKKIVKIKKIKCYNIEMTQYDDYKIKKKLNEKYI